MAKSRVLAIAAIVLIGTVSNVFALDLSKWKYRAEITIEDGAGEYCSLTLTPDIYSAARLDLGDIRLVDTYGEQVPYVLAKPKDITGRQKYNPAIINRSTNVEGAAMLTLDFGKKVVKNSIEVVTRGNNFRRAVRVEGSNDNIEFFTLVGRAYVFAVTYDRRFEQVDLPANDYRYLRIAVTPMATEQISPVIDAVKASKVEHEFAERQAVEMLNVEHSEDEESNSSIYIYDLAYNRLPINEIELDIADDAFYRYVTVQGRDAATRKVEIDSEDNRQRFREVQVRWEGIVSDTIYKYAEENGKKRDKVLLRIPASRPIHRYLKITIQNYDDRPITVKSASAKMIAHRIVFAAPNNAAPTLYVGSESARRPQFDLKYRLTDPLHVNARIAKLSIIADNQLFGQAEPKHAAWTERHKLLLVITLVAVALVLGGFMLKSLKSIQAEEMQD